MDQEEEKRQQTEAAEAAISLSASKQICNIEGEGETDVDDNKKYNEKMEITNKIESRHRRSSTENKFNTPQLGDDLCAKIYAAMEKHRDDFLVIRLHSAESAASLEVSLHRMRGKAKVTVSIFLFIYCDVVYFLRSLFEIQIRLSLATSRWAEMCKLERYSS